MPELIKKPGDFAEAKPPLQFLQSEQSNLVVKIEELHTLRDYVKDLPVTVIRPIHADHLESLVHSDLKTWPPIMVTLTNIGYICYDGLYRIQACKVLKIETIPARIVNFKNMNEIIEAVFRANLTHGLRASMTTRSDYCYWLHITYPRLSQRDIATRVGIAQSTVSRAIEQRTKEQDTNKDTTMTREQVAQEKEKQAQDFTKSTSKFLRLTTSFLNTVKREDYDDFVWNLQAELLNGPEDRQALLRAGQFLMDIAKARRKAKAPEPVGRK